MDLDESFESPQDELDFLLASEEEDIAEQIDYHCLHTKAIICEVEVNGVVHRFKVHFGCWQQFELRNIAVVLRYQEEIRHLSVNAPFIGCAHCGVNLVSFSNSSDCETCVGLRMDADGFVLI
jgi:hypothetical protein